MSAEAGEDLPQPRVLVQDINVPPALPWDQAKAAHLQAVRAAPLPASALELQLIRLSPWRPKASGRFLAGYLRKTDLKDRIVADVGQSGKTIRFLFRTERQRKREYRQLATQAGVVILGGLLVVGAPAAAIATRIDADRTLNELEARAAAELRRSQAESELKQQARALAALDNPGQPLSTVLREFGWAARARQPQTPIEGFHWRNDGVGYEVRAEGIPFKDQQVVRIEKPLKPGVWLWAKTR